MKKKILLLGAIGLTGFGLACGNPMMAKAEESSSEPETSQSSEAGEESSFDFGAWIQEKFDAKTIITLLSDGVFVGAILKLITSLIKEKKLTLEAKNEATKVVESLKNVLGDEVIKHIEDKFSEIQPKINEMSEKTQNVLTKFAEVLALSQENSPESRVAILEILGNMNLVADDVIEEAKKEIEDEVKADEEHVEAVVENLDKIIDDKKEEEEGLR